MVNPRDSQSLVEEYGGETLFSPTYLLFCAEGLSYLLNDAVSRNLLYGYSICHNAPPILDLLFADDSIIFCDASKEEAEVIKSILRSYKAASR